jgi:hypothetical protein
MIFSGAEFIASRKNIFFQKKHPKPCQEKFYLFLRLDNKKNCLLQIDINNKSPPNPILPEYIFMFMHACRKDTLQHGEAFCQQFFPWYNQEHYHSGIAWLTPESVHYQRDQTILEQRHAVLMKAILTHPERFNHKPPQLKKLPKAVYINPPELTEIENKFGQNKGCVAS